MNDFFNSPNLSYVEQTVFKNPNKTLDRQISEIVKLSVKKAIETFRTRVSMSARCRNFNELELNLEDI